PSQFIFLKRLTVHEDSIIASCVEIQHAAILMLHGLYRQQVVQRPVRGMAVANVTDGDMHRRLLLAGVPLVEFFDCEEMVLMPDEHPALERNIRHGHSSRFGPLDFIPGLWSG